METNTQDEKRNNIVATITVDKECSEETTKALAEMIKLAAAEEVVKNMRIKPWKPE